MLLTGIGLAALLAAPPADGRSALAVLDPADAATARAFEQALEEVLFRAGPQADVAAAKEIADLARRRGVAGRWYLWEIELETADRCAAAGEPSIPALDLPDAAARAFYADAYCPDLRPTASDPDGSSYRKCLLAQEERDGNRVAELYANGWGVRRDLRLATALVCHASGVPAELIGMVETLAAMQAGEDPGVPFRFCAHVTSALNGQYCLEERREHQQEHRQREVAQLVRRWTTAQREALRALLAEAEALGKAEAAREDVGPEQMPHYAEVPLMVEAGRIDGALREVQGFEEAQPPSGWNYADVDRELNQRWKALMSRTDLDREALRELQRRWLRYREAWARFGRARHTGSSGDAWRAWLTRQRIGELEQL